jgi:tetratricopeptide (TPR) repeat protein
VFHFWRFYAVVCLALLGTGSFICAQSEGQKLFAANRPDAAIPVLEKEIQNPDASPSLYIYLGIAYYQTGNYERSLSVFEMGLKVRGADIYTLSLNAGNTAFAMKDYGKACDYYTAAAEQDQSKSLPVLNCANARIKQGRLSEALASYRKFLALAPQDPQAGKITQLISLLEEELERRRAEEEKKKAQTEAVSREIATPEFQAGGQLLEEPVAGTDSVTFTDTVKPSGEKIVPQESNLEKSVLPQIPAEQIHSTDSEDLHALPDNGHEAGQNDNLQEAVVVPADINQQLSETEAETGQYSLIENNAGDIPSDKQPDTSP